MASTILGYFYRSNADVVNGFPLPPIVVRGIAPDVTVIPVRVLADYQIPALPKCTEMKVVCGWRAMRRSSSPSSSSKLGTAWP